MVTDLNLVGSRWGLAADAAVIISHRRHDRPGVALGNLGLRHSAALCLQSLILVCTPGLALVLAAGLELLPLGCDAPDKCQMACHPAGQGTARQNEDHPLMITVVCSSAV